MTEGFWTAFGGGLAGGLLSLIAVLGSEWLRWFLDRPLLKIHADASYIFDALEIAAGKNSEKQLVLQASNPRSKPVTVSGFGLSLKSKKLGHLWILPQSGYTFPYTIEGGKSLHQWTSLSTLARHLKEEGHKPSDLKYAWFRSSAGNTFRGKIDPEAIRELQHVFESL